MKIIKHFNMEYDYKNIFSFESKFFELTKGNNLELSVTLFNDIGYDFYDKIARILNDNNIEFFRNDVNVKLFNTISHDLNERFSKTGEIEYVPNEKYTHKQFYDYIKNNSSVIFEFGYFHFLTNNKLDRDYHTIRYKRDNETNEITELREYFEDVLCTMSYKIESEYEKIKTKENTNELELLDLSKTSAVEKIIYLNELEIIDFLRTKAEFVGSTNLMATFLSAITGVKPQTLQTSLNRLISNDVEDKNHPYKTKKTVEKVRQQLIEKNIKLKTS
ncbi:hypothetical protein [Flavobacterium aquiphilum]|uniref:hypothetical protein n=1 Tax=Flavobacterium aquiphilum TaxID=3003261 RepID=UPI00247FE8B2|nr:hypothetical protein [Flavobacterium aquiphilum]